MDVAASIVAGFSIGFVGSFHCIGMCGPLALALPVDQEKPLQKALAVILYNLGRALTYALMGGVFGLIGRQFVLIGYQQALSIAMGSLVLLLLILSQFFNTERTLVGRFNLWLKSALARFLQPGKGVLSFLVVGLLNGLLPCGLVYLAIATATAGGDSAEGALLMFAFGFGTFPMMISVMYLGRFISFSFRSKLRKAVPLFIGLTAVLLIIRGLGLGISYISPSFAVNEKQCVQGSCCEEGRK